MTYWTYTVKPEHLANAMAAVGLIEMNYRPGILRANTAGIALLLSPRRGLGVQCGSELLHQQMLRVYGVLVPATAEEVSQCKLID